MKGIILAGGNGSRLYPLTIAVNKHLLPVYDKPMIFYPLSVLMIQGIREILFISSPETIYKYQELLGDGGKLGMEFSYKIQEKPLGIPQAFIIGAEFIGDGQICFILGDNFFHGKGFFDALKQARDKFDQGALIFAYREQNGSAHGVVEFDENGKVLSIEEKPQRPRSDYAVPGMYFYDSKVIEIAKKLKPSIRGELEITHLNLEYLKLGKLKLELLEGDFIRYDMGTPDALCKAGELVMQAERSTGEKIACIEEIAYLMNFISETQLKELIDKLPRCSYADYLRIKYFEGSQANEMG